MPLFRCWYVMYYIPEYILHIQLIQEILKGTNKIGSKIVILKISSLKNYYITVD